jgi:hypothetical protein
MLTWHPTYHCCILAPLLRYLWTYSITASRHSVITNQPYLVNVTSLVPSSFFLWHLSCLPHLIRCRMIRTLYCWETSKRCCASFIAISLYTPYSYVISFKKSLAVGVPYLFVNNLKMLHHSSSRLLCNRCNFQC